MNNLQATRMRPTGDPHAVQRWSVSTLAALIPIPNASPDVWRYTLIPMLVRQGVLRKVGGRWHGKRADIEAALFPQSPAAPTP
jgi:hypothetical protein